MARLEPPQQASVLQQSYRPGFVAVSPLTMHTARQSHGDKKNDPKAQLLSFPATRAILWDKRPLGDSVIVHPTYYREPVLVLEEQTLRLAHRFSQQCPNESYLCFMLSNLSADADGQGLCFNVNRFEANEKVAFGQGHDVAVSCLVKKDSAKPKTSSTDFGESIQSVCSRCYSKSKLELQKFVSLKAFCSYHENQQTFIFHLDFTLVTCGTKFKATPVAPVPIVPTALSKNLSGPKSMSQIQGEAKSGYLTMDQTRKLLLVLESDPKVDGLPLVGIWLSGVSEITNPFVWIACLRYLFNPSLKERVVTPPEAFLIVLYSNVRSKPDFYECVTTDGGQKLTFSLSSCHEVIQLPKDTLRGSGSPYEMELVTVESGDKQQAFEAALENNRNLLSPQRTQVRQPSFSEDITPRTGPMPQIRKAADIRPSVPEVSLLLDEPEVSVAPRPVPRPMQMTHSSSHPEPNHSRNKKKSTQRQSLSSAETLQRSVPNAVGSFGNSGLYQNSENYAPPYTSGAAPVYQNTAGHFPGTSVSTSMGPNPMSPQYGGGMVQAPYTQAARPYGYQPYDPNVPYMYPVPPHMYGSIPGPNMPWHGMMPGYMPSQGPVGNVSSGAGPPQPAFSPQLPVYSNRFANQMQVSTSVPQSVAMTQNGPYSEANVSTSQTLVNSSVAIEALRSPVLRPVRDNSEMEDSQIRHDDLENSAPVAASNQSPSAVPRQNSSRNGSHHNSPQQRAQTASSSTDSGLHFSDNLEPEAGNNTIESLRSAAGGEIQPQVLELLRMQDEQLKMLRDQLAQLLSGRQQQEVANNTQQQSLTGDASCSTRSSEATLQGGSQNATEIRLYHDMATQMSNQPTPIKQVPVASQAMSTNKRSSGVNTSLFSNASIEQARSGPYANRSNPNDSQQSGLNYTLQDLSIQAGFMPNDELQHTGPTSTPVSTTANTRTGAMMMNDSYASVAAREGVADLSLPPPPPVQRFSQEGVASVSTTGGETVMSFGDFQQQLQIQERTQSVMSDMLVDMPAYTSLSPEKQGSHFTDTDESNRSPMLGESVSMYEQQMQQEGEYEEDYEDDGAPVNTLLFKDHRLFYQNLMGNVQKLLGNTQTTHDDTTLEHQTPQRHSLDSQLPRPSFGTDPRPTPQSSSGAVSHHLNRSLSVPEHMKEGGCDRQGQHGRSDGPLRQSYPFTENHNRHDALSEQDVDLEERTRQQLQAMGIELEKMNSEEKSRIMEHSSFFLDPSLLPRLQYSSLVFDSDSGDSDLSTHADALAMKYLSDEQLSELARLRQSGAASRNATVTPSKKRRPLGLERLLQSPGGIGAKSNNTTMFGVTNMSFASRKYLERYGLLDGANGGGQGTGRQTAESQPQEGHNDSAQGGWGDTQGVKVKDFMKTLRERSLNSIEDFQAVEEPNYAQESYNTARKELQMSHTPVTSKPAENCYFEPNHNQEPADNRPIFNTSAPPMHPDEKEVHVFKDVPSSVPRQQPRKMAHHGLRKSVRDSDQTSDVVNVLDIARLKELPKLL